MEERRKWPLHHCKGQVNSKFFKSKGIIKVQGGQRCEERSKVVKSILSFWGQPPY